MPVRDDSGTVGHPDGTRPFVAVVWIAVPVSSPGMLSKRIQRGRTRDGWPDSNRCGMRVSV
jgi:hypothetical protein